MYVLQWTNNHSQEKGFVESISAKERCFINTFDLANAKKYASTSVAKRMITSLQSYGETENNTFAIIEV